MFIAAFNFENFGFNLQKIFRIALLMPHLFFLKKFIFTCLKQHLNSKFWIVMQCIAVQGNTVIILLAKQGIPILTILPLLSYQS